MDEIKVSVVMLTYNHVAYVRQTIESILMQQTDFRFELLVHDDASTDGTADIIREYEEEYPDTVKPIYQTENQYQHDKRITLNYNYPRCKGTYIAFCEGDDYWTDPYKLQKQVDIMDGCENCSMTYHATEMVDEDGRLIDCIKPFDKKTKVSAETFILGFGGCATASMMYRSSHVFPIPDFLRICDVHDAPIKWLMAYKGDIIYLPDVMAAYRFGHEGSWSKNTYLNDSKGIRASHEKNIIEALESYNDFTKGLYSDLIQMKIKWIKTIYLEERLRPYRLGEFKKMLSHHHLKTRLSYWLRIYMPGVRKLMKRG